MTSPHDLLVYLLTSVVLIEIPGPSLLFALGRALSSGRREAVLSAIGNAIGLMCQVVAVAVGLGPVVAASAAAFTVLKIVGGSYVIYLGVQAIRHRRDARIALDAPVVVPVTARRALRTGLLVGLTNPKTVVFFVAFLPQFVNPSHAAGPQMLLLGFVFAVLGGASDTCWVLAAARAKAWFARRPARLDGLSAGGGVMMIGLGGVLLATGNRH